MACVRCAMTGRDRSGRLVQRFFLSGVLHLSQLALAGGLHETHRRLTFITSIKHRQMARARVGARNSLHGPSSVSSQTLHSPLR